MKKAKIKNHKKSMLQKEENYKYSLKSVFIILIVILIFLCCFYLLTVFIVNNKSTKEENVESKIDSTKILMNDILKQKEEKYYVLAYDTSDSNIELYNEYINQNKEKYTFYVVDLDDVMNSKFIGDNNNISDNLDDLVVSNTVLLRVEKNVIIESYTTISDIEKELKSL